MRPLSSFNLYIYYIVHTLTSSLVWALWYDRDVATCMGDTRGGLFSFTFIPDISTALMRPGRLKPYCLQLVIYYIYKLSGWMGSVSYGLGADLSLPPCLSVTIGIWTLAHKSDPRAEILGEIVRYNALAPLPEVLLSWCFVCACASSL